MTTTQIVLSAAFTSMAATLTAWAIDALMEARRKRAKEIARCARVKWDR
jgi:hypothetical protein